MKLIGAWYMNLERSLDKSTYTRAMLTGVNCLYENIHRIDTYDFKCYANIATLCDAAVADPRLLDVARR